MKRGGGDDVVGIERGHDEGRGERMMTSEGRACGSE
jgi:hypothetical protein